MNDYTIQIEFRLTTKELAGCVNSAIDPAVFGSRRWIKKVHSPTPGTYLDVIAADKAVIVTTVDGVQHVINCFKLAAGMRSLLTPKGGSKQMMINLDPGAFDANLADELLQHTLFGEIVYD